MADTQTLIAKVNDSATKGIQQIEIKQNEAIQAITATQMSATQAVTAEVDKIVEKSKRFLNVLTKLNNKSMALEPR